MNIVAVLQKLFFRGRRRRAVSLIEQVALTIPNSLKSISPSEKTAILGISNALLLSLAAEVDKRVSKSPHLIPDTVVVPLIFNLALDQTDLVNNFIIPMKDRGTDDVVLSQALRQARAIEIVIVTVGLSLIPGMKESVVAYWKRLLDCRSHAQDGMALLLQYSQLTKSSPIPKIPNFKVDKSSVLTLCSVPPQFLRPKKAMSKNASSRKSGAK